MDLCRHSIQPVDCSCSKERREPADREPAGTKTAELLLSFFAPYAPAGAISRLDGLNLGDAYARVTRGASLWALVLSCFGLSTLLSIKATGEKLGGIMSVAGLFFYGSLLSLFSPEANSSSHISRAILFAIPNVDVLGSGGPFSHLILGHSVLHGLSFITAIMGLCLVARDQEPDQNWRRAVLVALPALAVPVHSVAALYCVGVVGILLFWGHLRESHSWLLVVLMFGLFLGAWKIMGFAQAPDAALATFNQDAAWSWWMVSIWFMVGLGFRVMGFRWISRPLSDPLSVLVLASVLGLLSFSLLLQFEHGQQRYGIYFLQSMFSIFAFSRMKSGWWRGIERSRWVVDWLGLMGKGVLLLVACALLMRAVFYAAHSQAWVASFRLRIVPLSLLVLLLAGIVALMKRSPRFSTATSGIVMGMLLIGFAAWIAPWLNFGMGRMKMDVTLTQGEVQGLTRLGELAKRDERFATNKHAIEGVAALPDRSYAYGTLSERPVLLEGYSYQGVQSLPYFKTLLHDNDSMFSATDPQTLRALAQSWHVRWLVARPGTDIAISKPLPAWLVEQPNCGDLKIYRID